MPHRLGAIHRETPAHIPDIDRLAELQLAVPPHEVDWHKAFPPNGDALGNNDYGNCVECAEYQAIGMRRANAWGDTWRPTKGMTLDLYAKLTGFDLTTGVPDNGTDTVEAMTDWSTNGIRLDSQNEDFPLWFSVQRRAISNVKLAIAHFGPVQLSLAMPAGLQDNPEATWALPTGIPLTGEWAPGSWGGHRVVTGKYKGDIFTVRTWGVDVDMTLAFWLTYGLAADVTISRQWMNTKGVSASGLTWDAMRAEAGSLRA